MFRTSITHSHTKKKKNVGTLPSEQVIEKMWAEVTGGYVNNNTNRADRYITQERKKGKGKRCQEISEADAAEEKGILDGGYSRWTANGR